MCCDSNCIPCCKGHRRKAFALSILILLSIICITVFFIFGIINKNSLDFSYFFVLGYTGISFKFIFSMSIISLVLIVGAGIVGLIFWILNEFELIVKITLHLSFWTDCIFLIASIILEIISIYLTVICWDAITSNNSYTKEGCNEWNNWISFLNFINHFYFFLF